MSNVYDVYVTEVSVNERIHFFYGDIKTKYEKIEEARQNLSRYVTIAEKMSFSDSFEKKQNEINATYLQVFRDQKIIKLSKDMTIFEAVLDRDYKHIAPFQKYVPDGKQSDKGFKDSLIWLSILHKYESMKNDSLKVYFITDDKYFSDRSNELSAEFLERTGMTIRFFKNNRIPEFEIKETKPAEETVREDQEVYPLEIEETRIYFRRNTS